MRSVVITHSPWQETRVCSAQLGLGLQTVPPTRLLWLPGVVRRLPSLTNADGFVSHRGFVSRGLKRTSGERFFLNPLPSNCLGKRALLQPVSFHHFKGHPPRATRPS